MFKRILLGFSICLSIWKPLSATPYQSDKFLQNNGGLANHISPLLVQKNEASDINNITMDDRGQLTKRNGYTVVQSTFVLLGFSTWVVTGASYHTAASGSDYFAVVVGTTVFKAGNTYTTLTPALNNAVITATTANLAQATHLQDFTVFCNEVDKPFYVGASVNATQISTSTFTAAKTCATYGAYLVVGNTTESASAFPTRVRWSDINNINSFPPLNYIDVEPSDGDKIVGVIAWDESVYIFKHRSIYRMLITGQDGPDAFIIRPVARNIGAWSKMSIRAIPNVGIIFLAQNTAYLLNDSGLTPIGDKIQRTFDSVTRPMWANAVGGVYPKKYQYWLAVSTSGTTNTEVLVYDYVQSNWTVYSGMKLSMIEQGEDSNGNNLLLSGGYTDTVWKQDNGTSDNPKNTATAIVGSYTTGNNTFDSPEVTKNFKYLYIYSLGDSSYVLNVKAAYNFNTDYEYNQNITLGSAGAVYDTGLYDTDLYPSGGYVITRLELNRDAKSLRLQFNNSTLNSAFGVIGWAIVYTKEDYTQ
jgi:hypothetical protein